MSIVQGEIARFNTIGAQEIEAVVDVMKNHPLSGFLGGELEGGHFVRRLESNWAAKFSTNYAISVNSATSALHVACRAIGLRQGDEVIVPPYTMSASVAAPVLCGATPVFVDIEPETFSLDFELVVQAITKKTKAIIVTNLFGHPAKLHALRYVADNKNIRLIEDNAQSILAKENNRFTGTIGHIGIWSLNFHKQIQAGEGGICTTNDDELATKMKLLRNHAELAGGEVGLNLRLGEIAAAIADVQLSRVQEILVERKLQAEKISDIFRNFPSVKTPTTRDDCSHSFYIVAFLVDGNRDSIVQRLRQEGFPLEQGYVEPIYRLPVFRKFAAKCPVAEELFEHKLFLFENCCYSPTETQLSQMKLAAHMVIGNA